MVPSYCDEWHVNHHNNMSPCGQNTLQVLLQVVCLDTLQRKPNRVPMPKAWELMYENNGDRVHAVSYEQPSPSRCSENLQYLAAKRPQRPTHRISERHQRYTSLLASSGPVWRLRRGLNLCIE